VYQLTDNWYEDSLPQIKGDYVVWQGKVNGYWEIFICSIHSPETPIRITDNGYDDISPKTDGNHVVWLGDSRSGGEVFLYDIESGGITQITDNDNADTPPQIADGLVVWASQEVTDSVEPGEIMLYHIATGVTEQLTNDTLDDGDPRISSEKVFWVKTDGEDNATPFIHDIATGVTSEAPKDFVWQDSAQVDGNLAVLTRHDGDDREIFLRNIGSSRYHQISDNELEDRYPSISENNIAWMAAGEIFLAEYEYLGLLSPVDNVGLPNSTAPTFTWEGIGYDEFKIEFSGSPSFPTLKASVFPSIDESWMFESSFAPTTEQWKAIGEMQDDNGTVYWRVEGRDAVGSVSLTETRKFTIDEPSTSPVAAVEENADDMTASGGKSCFIDTALSWDGS
jgi:hypothetical protein